MDNAAQYFVIKSTSEKQSYMDFFSEYMNKMRGIY